MGYYKQCYYCGKYVNLAKPIFGSLHICVTDKEREMIDRQQILINKQLKSKLTTKSIIKILNPESRE